MNLKLGTRLGLSFGAVLLLAAIIAVVGATSLRAVMGSFRFVTSEVLPKSDIANSNIREAYDYARAFAYIVTSEGRPDADAQSLKTAHDVLVATVKAVNNNVATLEPMLSTAEEKALLADVKARRAAYGKSRNQVLELKKAGAHDKAAALMFTETNALQTVYIDAWKTFIGHEKKQLISGVETAEGDYRQATGGLYAVLAVALVAGLGVAIALTRWVLAALGGEPAYAAAIAGRIALGDLSVDVQIRPGDKASLLFAMKTMRDNLDQIVGQVRAGTDSIATATAQIASGNMDLSSRTEQQASSLQQTASSMEELTATVKQNSASAQQANQLAASASSVAVKGGEAVVRVVDTMGAVNVSSKRVVDIIGVIDGIAFQTNILALAGSVTRGVECLGAVVRVGMPPLKSVQLVAGTLGNGVHVEPHRDRYEIDSANHVAHLLLHAIFQRSGAVRVLVGVEVGKFLGRHLRKFAKFLQKFCQPVCGHRHASFPSLRHQPANCAMHRKTPAGRFCSFVKAGARRVFR